MTEIKVGNTLWYVPIYKRELPRDVTVTKVGRKWIEIDPSWFPRLDKDTLFADGGKGVSPGRAYISKGEWEIERDTNQAWGEFRTAIEKLYHRPQHLKLEEIQEMAEKIFGKAALEGGE